MKEENSVALPYAPVPVGIVDGSLDSSQVDHWDEEADLLKQNLNNKNQDTINESEADLNGSKEEQLNIAAAEGYADRVISILKSYNFKTSDLVMSLCYAAGAGKIDCIKIILDLSNGRVGIDDSNKTGRTALHWAARNSQVETCKFLVANGADVTLTTPDGVNCLAWAVWGGCLDTVKWAVDSGVDPFALNRWGCGLIHWASAGGNVELCKYLQNSVGLNFSIKNNQGHNGLAKAAWNNHRSLCEFFLFQHIEGSRDLDIVYNDSKIQKMLHEKDRAGLRVHEIARINGNVKLADWLESLIKNGTENDGQCMQNVNELVPKAFQIYYQTQNILETTHADGVNNEQTAETSKKDWNNLLALLTSAQPIGLSALHLPASWTPLVKEVEQWLLSLGLKTENGVHIIEKKEWLQQPQLRSKCELLEKAGLLVLDERCRMENHIIKLLLDVNKEHLVLYIKTSSIQPALFTLQDTKNCDHINIGSIPSFGRGAIVINDVDSKHLISETSAIRKKGSSSGSILTVSSSLKFPCLFEKNENQILFDRIFVKPTCTEDGDTRVNPHIWPQWKMENGIRMHATNLKLLLRGLHQLKVGGRLVYTTRSLNPIENEAVVLAALIRYKGQVELVANDTQLVTLLSRSRYHGLTKWLVPDVTMLEGQSLFRFLDSWEDVPERHRFPNGPLRKTMFCTQEQHTEIDNDIDHSFQKQLLRCLRFTPLQENHENCFFAAVFTKKGHRSAEASDWTEPGLMKAGNGKGRLEEETKPASKTERIQRKVQKPPKFAKDYLPISIETWQSIAQFYGIENGEKLYLEFSKQVVDKSDEMAALAISILSTGSHKLYEKLDATPKLSVIHAGVRLFEPMGNLLENCTCRWRPSQQGLAYLAPLCSKRVIRIKWLLLEDGRDNMLKLKMKKDLATLFRNQKLILSRDARDLEVEIQQKCCPGGIIIGVTKDKEGNEESVLDVNEDNDHVVFWLSGVLTSTSLLLHADSQILKGIASLCSAS